MRSPCFLDVPDMNQRRNLTGLPAAHDLHDIDRPRTLSGGVYFAQVACTLRKGWWALASHFDEMHPSGVS